ncbi:MAG: hypothetical protein Q9227_009296 [Pyrenula ochraceoflavens]
MPTAAAKSSSNFKSDFLFVTHEPKNVNRVKERRSHAVREHFRKRRWQKANDPLPLRHDYPWTQRLSPTNERPLGTRRPTLIQNRPLKAQVAVSSTPQPSHKFQPGRSAAPDHQSSTNSSQRSRGSSLESGTAASSALSKEREYDELALVASPSSPSALDPFSQMPVNFATTEETLISHFLTQPNISWGIDTSKIFSIHRDIVFPAAVQHESTMLTTLLYASIIKDRVSGSGLTPATLNLWKKSVASVSNRIRDPRTRYTGTLISGVATILMVEDMTERTSNMVQHFAGYNQMLRLHGGPQGFQIRNEHSDDVVIFVQALLLSKREMSMLPLIDPSDANGAADLWTYYHACNEFAAKLHGFRELLEQEGSANLLLARSHRAVATVFSRDNLLLQRLRHALVTGFRGPLFVENVHSQVWFIIMWMVLTLWDYRENQAKCKMVFGKLVEDPYKTSIKNIRSTHGLSWLFISQIDEASDRRWTALNMVKVLHRLRPDSRTKVLERSLEMLEISSDGVLGTGFTKDEIEQMRNEALEGLPLRFDG